MQTYEELIKHGGKHPEFLSEFEDEEVSIGVLPTEAFGVTQDFTQDALSRVLKNCKKFGTKYVVARTTHGSDVIGMVDTMPTEGISIDKISEAVSRVKRKILEKGEDCYGLPTNEEGKNYLEKYSREEGSGFIPEETQITIAPFIEENISVLTRHPNQEGVVLHDNLLIGRDLNNCDFPFNFDNIPSCDGYGERIMQAIEGKGVLPEDTAFQIELVFDHIRNKFWLLQIREFAKRRKGGFEIKNPYSKLDRIRNFGITTQKGLVLPFFRLKNRVGEICAGKGFGNKIPGYSLLTWENSQGVRGEEFPGKNQVGYLPRIIGKNMALSHNNTRFIQNALRHPNGFAILGDRNWDHGSIFDDNNVFKILQSSRARLARFFCNGKDFKVVPIQDNGKFDEFIQDAEMTWNDFLKEIGEE